jgi:fibronectin type 3 domain-containing protein
MSAAALNTAFTTYGNAGNHWTGADGTTSIALPDGRVVWFFSDTFLGTVNADFSRPAFTPLVNNSAIVQDGSSLTTTLNGGTSDEPKALVTPSGETGDFYWVADGVVEGDSLKVLYQRMRRGEGSGTLDFEFVGTALATFALPSLQLTSVTDLPTGSTIGWGSSVLADGGYTYIYGTSSAPGRMKFAHLARATAGNLGGTWQYWTGSAWSADQAAAGRILSGVGTAYSVEKIGAQYALVTHENNLLFDPQIVAYTASSPTGPFTGPRVLYTAPEVKSGSETIVYDVRLHPELARSGKLLLSYNVNSLKFADQMADVRLYRPRFIEVDWPLPAVPTSPAAPTGLSVSAADDYADLTWSAVTGATAYRVYQRDVTGGQTHFARRPASVTATSSRVNLLIPGHQYEFKVAAVTGTTEGPQGAVAVAVPRSTKPVADVIRFAGTPEAIAGSYLIALRPGAVPQEGIERFGRQLIAQHGGTFLRTLAVTHGFWATMTEAQARDLASHPDVIDVEQDSYAAYDAAGTQTGAPWHLDRIDQKTTKLDTIYRYPGDGAGVTAWVVDSGLQPGHSELTGRVLTGKNMIDLSTDTADCNGHGTKMAGVLGGSSTGVAKGVKIVPIKVGRCGPNPQTGHIVSGIDWVTNHATAPAVLNLSLSKTAIDGGAQVSRAAARAVAKGITVVTSAGNSNTVACAGAPNDVDGVIVVGATAKPTGDRDVRLDDTSFGACVDLFAPGDGISAPTFDEDPKGTGGSGKRYATAEGTSPAAAMVSGAAAILLETQPGSRPVAVQQALVAASGKGVVDNAMSANDGLLYIEQPPLTAPTNLTATPNTDGTIALRWDAVPEPNVHYVVSSRDVTAGETDFVAWDEPVFNATSTVSKELLPEHRYEFVVQAANTAGLSPRSNVASATADFGAPAKVTGLTATAQNDGTIKLTWNSLGANTWYWVYQRDLTAGETEMTKLSLPIAEGTTMTAGFLAHGHQYEFRVAGYNRGGEGPQSDPATATSNYPAPAAPTGLTATAGDGQAVLRWNAVTPDAWYLIHQRDVTAGEAEFTELPLPIAEGTTMTAGYLTNGHTYEYRVTASVQGRVSAPSSTVRVTPQMALPGTVTNLTATAGTNGTIALAWTAPAENLWFDVYQRDVTAGESFRKLEYPVTSCCAFTASLLTNDHVYEFRVAATNAAGAGPQSNTARATARYSPPAAPKNLRGEAIGNATINLDWDPPAAGSYYYWVYYRDVTAGQSTFTKSQLPTQKAEAGLGLLIANHVYEYRVTAENAGGEGPASNTVQVTARGGLPAAPSNLTATPANGEVRLSWTASGTSGVQYNVYQRNASDGQSWQKLPIPVTGTSMTAGLLTNGKRYEFRVSAANSAGASGFSNVASATPMPPLPAAPSGLSASAGDGRVNLSWTKSSTANVFYWVEMRVAGGTWDRLPYPVSTCCSLTVNALANGKYYEFRVRANNLAGDSGASNVATARPMPPFPQPASGLSATAGDGRVSLRWTASPTNGVSYLIDMRAKGGSWQKLPYPVGCCSFTVSLLNNGTTYEFRIRATNMTGTAAASNTASARPMPPIPAAPTNLRASGNAQRVNLSWSPSSTSYVGYRVYMRNASTGQAWTLVIASPVNNSLSLYNLFRGDTYQFRVTAHNIAGESSPSNVTTLRMEYLAMSLSCIDYYVGYRGAWLGSTIGRPAATGTVSAANVNINVRYYVYIDGRFHASHGVAPLTDGGGRWRHSGWQYSHTPMGSTRNRLDFVVRLSGAYASGEASGYCVTNQPG